MMIDYDKHSLIIDNKRTVINSASFHYFRCPGVETWRDRLSKIKACGYNTVDLYFCWGYHSHKQGVYDFTGIKDIRALLDLTAELDLFVIARPGPFINAEVSLGGLPEWLLNIPEIFIRNKKDGDFVYSEPYMKALREWYSRIIPIINEYHNIITFQIENEYFTNEAEPDYLQELYDMARSLGVKAPISHNDALSVGLYSDIVNIYAFDTYPTINLDYDWKDFPDSFGVLDNAESNLGECCEDAPLFIAELQAGWFDKWGGIGYEKIWSQFKKEHINIVTKTALSQGITMFNHYMGCGGTSWGKLASSEVYTSYDFAAPISESGIPRENYYKAKEINYLLNSFNFASTNLISEGAEIIGEKRENIFARLRQDNLNNCKWLFIRNLNKDTQKLKVLDSYDINIKPFDMKIMPVDLDLNACRINFSSFEIFGRVNKDNHEIIFFIIDENSEIFVSDYGDFSCSRNCHSEGFSPKNLLNSENKQLDRSFVSLRMTSKALKDLDSFKFAKQDKTTEFIFISPETADKTWVFDNKVLIGADFLTNNFEKAAFGQDGEIKILNLEKDAIWEVKEVKVSQQEALPELTNWKSFRCSPEIDLNYDYSGWNLLTEPEKSDCISNKVYDDYIWYKTSLKHVPEQIEINAKHCYAVYLNGKQIYSHNSHSFEHGHELSETITFNVDKKHVNKTGTNELTILVQNLGFDKGFQNELIMPRGIISFKTIPCQEIEWRIRGELTPQIEEWDFAPEEDLENSSENSYLIWLGAKFRLVENNNKYNPLFLDLSEAEFNCEAGVKARNGDANAAAVQGCNSFNKADIYLNGNLIGRFWKSKGPQTKFYLPEEFLQPHNKLSLIIWDREDDSKDLKDYKSKPLCVKIKIGNIKTFSLVSVE
ncbi:MAG TPA: hypothetical protein DDW90_08040 [Cyanobacteria bacterium UBA9971]|nr:hypothetical protein [Cyanobacteria bacterium UBA9971]